MADFADDVTRGIWKPSIHMPRAACRLILDIASVRVERLWAISEDDVFAEGVSVPVDGNTGRPLLELGRKDGPASFLDYAYNGEDFVRAHYAALWSSINGRASWDANPWVWVVEFKRVKA